MRAFTAFALLISAFAGSPALAREVGEIRFRVTDSERKDPVSPQHQREWMVTLFYPAQGRISKPLPYAPDPELASALEASGYYDTPKTEIEKWKSTPGPAYLAARPLPKALPVITLSPGLGVAGFNYSRLASDLADRGYAVVVIEHPYIATSRLFSGRVMKAEDYAATASEEPQEQGRLVEGWSRDISVTLDRLRNQRKLDGLVAGLFIDPERVIAVGHSIGGAVALQSCEDDARVVACADFEGAPVETASLADGRAKPSLFVLSRSGMPDRPHIAPPIDRPPFSIMAQGSKQGTWLLAVRGGSHMSYSDAPFVMPTTLSRFGGELMTPTRSMEVYVGLTDVFAKTYLSHQPESARLSSWLNQVPEIRYTMVPPS